MNPIFKEYIQFLHDNNIDLDLKEGCYWLDRQIIKAYDSKGKQYKIARLKIDDKLNISAKLYKKEEFEIESWQETALRNIIKLIRLENKSLDLIKNRLNKYKNHIPIILTSGGKDSSVTLYLTRKVNPSIQGIFNNTTLDCADTYKHIKSIDNIQTMNPKKGFYQWIKTNIIPNRFSRGCCRVFKEGEMIEQLDKNEKYLFFIGMRNEESAQRSDYQDDWKNEKWTNRDWEGLLPIREWTEEDVWLYIFARNIEINQKYKKGYARVGCAIACPFYTKSTWVLDKYWYPKMFDRWHRILEQDFKENYKWTRLNCTLEEYHMNWNGGLVRLEPTEEVVKEFAEFKDLDYELAQKYFNHECVECRKKVNTKDEIAMNLKFIGRNINDFYCKKHFMQFIGMSKEQWNEYIDDFKDGGCKLF